MARIRETLWKVDGSRGTQPAAAPSACPNATAHEPAVEEKEVPFIEVGGPHKMIEASPSVMAIALPIPAKKSTARQEETKSESPSVTAVETPKAAAKMSVSFRPLAREGSPLPAPAQRFARELLTFHQPDDPVSEQYRVLARDLAGQLSSKSSNILLFTAGTRRSEPAVIVLNLAITKALEGTGPVVVLDADIYEPRFAEHLGLPLAPGLRDVLSGVSSLQRAVQETGQPNLHALTAGRCSDGIPGLIAGEAMRSVLRHLRTRFGWILVSAPFWDGRPELMTLGTSCDAAYLVLPETEAGGPAVQELRNTLPKQGIPLRGCIYTGQ